MVLAKPLDEVRGQHHIGNNTRSNAPTLTTWGVRADKTAVAPSGASTIASAPLRD